MAAGDAGYKPGDARFTEQKLPGLLQSLAGYRTQPEGPERRVAQPVAVSPSSNRVVYVDARRPGAGDGRSWSTAYNSLNSALDDAGRDGAEIWVASGVYRPSDSGRSTAFVLRPGVKLYGGFSGAEKARTQRDWTKNVTTLSGEIGDPQKREDNSFHVLIGADGAVLDGFTITGGHADGIGYDGKGGGMINYRRAAQLGPNVREISGYSPEVRNCSFVGNDARDGGAVYSYDRGKPRFTGCIFRGNTAENGGAVLDRVGVQAVYENCEFVSNTAKWRGGAAYFDYGSRPRVINCVFRGNSTSGHGGAIYSLSRASQLENTEVTLLDSRFESNQARGTGGAVAFDDSTIATVRKCSFTSGRAGQDGGAIAVVARSTMESEGNTFNGNSAGRNGADVYTESASQRQPASGPPRGGGGPPRREPGAGRTYEPGGAFTVVTVGTGGPVFNAQRSGPSAIIQHRGRLLLVDMGNGTQARLNEGGIPLANIDALMFTHHHLDHDEEFIPMFIDMMLRGRPFSIIGTPGTRQYTEFIRSFYAEDMAYRMGRTGRKLEDAPVPAVREVSGGESFELGAVQIATAKVNHTIHTVSYRFSAEGKSIVISGDLSYSDSLISLAKGADVLVIDAGGAAMGAPGPSGRRSPGGRPGGVRPRGAAGAGQRAHSSLEEVAKMAQGAGTPCLVLTHLVSASLEERAAIEAIRSNYSGTVIVGRDLLEVNTSCQGRPLSAVTAAAR